MKKEKSVPKQRKYSPWITTPLKVIWWIIKGIFSIFKFVFSSASITAKKTIREVRLRQNYVYLSPSKFRPLEIDKKIAGNFMNTEKRLEKDSIIALIFGKRGSGKSALGFRLLENLHCMTKRQCFALSISQELLPKWVHPTEDIEHIPENSIILVDEGAVSFGSRDSMTNKNKELSRLLAIARHKNLTLIFVTQNTGLIDKNILKLVDILFVKEGSLLQQEMERSEVKKFYEKSKKALSHIKGNKISYAYVLDNDFEGVVSFSLPTFWTEKLSKNKSSN